MAKRALICGISGQDGAYLARLLLAKGYHVTGTSRDAQVASFANLTRLGIRERVELKSMVLTDFRSTLQTLNEATPDEIYNLAGQSSVGLSFQQPVETVESIGIGVLNLLEAIRFLGRDIRLYNASSSECFGETGGKPADEETPFHPRSPYAVAKAAAHWMVINYRDAYGLCASNGILFNHESPLRGETFVTRKITRAVAAIELGLQERLYIGNLDARRDWGHARDYVEGMWLMLQQDEPDDYVLATGEAHSVREFVERAFACTGREILWRGRGVDEVGLDAGSGKELVRIDPRYLRPTEVDLLQGDPSKAHARLGWRHRTTFADLVREMVEADLALVGREGRPRLE
jgi:GDPmannose 4,6-dehydratase